MDFTLMGLTSAERDMVGAVEAGSVFGAKTEEMNAWPVIRAPVIRNLLRGLYQDLVPDPKGLRLCRVRIDDRLDLDHLETKIPLDLQQCDLPQGLTAARAQVSVLRLRDLVIHRDSVDEAVLDLRGLHTEELDLSGTSLINDQGIALHADRLTVDANAYLNVRFTATGNSVVGAIRLPRASIGGKLFMGGAQLTNTSGPALVAGGITVHADVYLDEGFTAHGHGDLGAVRIGGATISGEFIIDGAKLTNTSGPALVADRLTVKGGTCIYLSPKDGGSDHSSTARSPKITHADRTSASAVVVLSGGDAGPVLDISPQTLSGAATNGGWDITGLTYRSLAKTTAENWLTFLKDGTREYSPQPYQHFSTVAHSQGEEKLTQKVLIAQRNDQLSRSRRQHGLLTRRQRASLWVLRATVGYGYKTWTALAWLALLVLIAVGLTLTMGAENTTVFQQPKDSTAGNAGDPCRTVDLWMLGLETIPLITFMSGTADTCTVADTAQGGLYLAVSILLKLLAWALVTLFVAGYTNIVRRPGP